MDRPRTLGELRASGYRSLPVKDEMRKNLIRKLQQNQPIFDGIIGYEETVLPQIQNAILSKHDMLFLGLRGQAKTRMLRQLVNLLDDAMPVIAGSEVNDDPLRPLSKIGRDLIAKLGDATSIEWVGREHRYHEKLATPDVTIADLIGEIDMIKHAEGRYLSSELTMHFGLIPRSNRGIFCMNELPDLAAKIQVGLFNVLEERDIQIRGYPIRLELDLCLVFSANPEDYTNRGRIVTPLKDRIGSVIRTHYPLTRDEGIAIVDANAWTERDGSTVATPKFMKEIVEETARLARTNQAINQQSGVSVRMSIANFENLVSNAERRGLLQGEKVVVPRVSDLASMLPSTRGKVELSMSEEDGQEDRVLAKLMAEAVKNIFEAHFDPKQFRPIVEWFEGNKSVTVGDRVPSRDYLKRVDEIPGLRKGVDAILARPENAAVAEQSKDGLIASAVEFILEGLHVHNRLNKNVKGGDVTFKR
ncbi:MAG: sigma 54-interacting transcriptional regulator [Gemmataceae bacterium]|nr:sigma 54-interacting transcriptional regulator [Gemmataceae bacterium]